MSVADQYAEQGHVHLPGFVPVAVANAFLAQLNDSLKGHGVDWRRLEQQSELLARGAPELYGYQYPPLIAFLWGMTPAISALLGKELLPTYSYFRIYRRGDVCRVHSDRPSCEVSMSLTLAYSDGTPWALEMGSEHLAEPRPVVNDDFGAEPHAAVAMAAGDAVLYQGVHRRHGRTTPNPNRWSAHAFLHWVDRQGPYADKSFDGRPPPEAVQLALG